MYFGTKSNYWKEVARMNDFRGNAACTVLEEKNVVSERINRKHFSLWI